MPPRIGRVDLQFEGCELRRLLLFSIVFVQAGLEVLGEEEWHGGPRSEIKRLPNVVEIWKGTQLFLGCNQRPAAVECRRRDEAISRIPMLKNGAAGENGYLRSER